MDKWMVEYKSWYQFAFDSFRERVKELLKTIDKIVFLNMNERLVYYLKSHQEILQSKNIPLTRTEIAKEFHSSREVITRLLKQLATKGKIKMHRSSLPKVGRSARNVNSARRSREQRASSAMVGRPFASAQTPLQLPMRC